jgi:DNA-binding Xre family transcriptional regulator
MADVVYNTIIKIESGTIQNLTIETLLKITKVLDAEVDDLIK